MTEQEAADSRSEPSPLRPLYCSMFHNLTFGTQKRGVRAINLSLLCPIKQQQRPIKKNKIHLLSAYYAPVPVLNTKHKLSLEIIKTTLAQKSYDCDLLHRWDTEAGSERVGELRAVMSQAASGPDGEH